MLMINAESLALQPGIACNKAIAGHNVRLVAIPNELQLPYDLALDAFGVERTYKQFAECTLGEKLGHFEAELHLAFRSRGAGFLAVVGLYKVLFINALTRTVHEPLLLFRDETDDRGFYRMQLHSLADGFLINYEGGVARVRDTGEVLWHRPMMWNDIFIRIDPSGHLFYRSEINPKGFLISTSDGAKTPLSAVSDLPRH